MGRKRKYENRFDVIVETAARLFIETGFEKTTMDDIAAACDLGKATLYAEFKTKEDLMQAVILRYVQQAHREMRQKLEDAKDNYMAVLRDILLDRILTVYDRANKHFHSIEIMMAARKGMTDPEPLRLQREEEFRILGELLAKAAEHGEIPPSPDYVYLAKRIRNALAGLYPPHIFDVSPAEFKADAEAIVDLVLTGLQTKHSSK